MVFVGIFARFLLVVALLYCHSSFGVADEARQTDGHDVIDLDGSSDDVSKKDVDYEEEFLTSIENLMNIDRVKGSFNDEVYVQGLIGVCHGKAMAQDVIDGLSAFIGHFDGGPALRSVDASGFCSFIVDMLKNGFDSEKTKDFIASYEISAEDGVDLLKRLVEIAKGGGENEEIVVGVNSVDVAKPVYGTSGDNKVVIDHWVGELSLSTLGPLYTARMASYPYRSLVEIVRVDVVDPDLKIERDVAIRLMCAMIEEKYQKFGFVIGSAKIDYCEFCSGVVIDCTGVIEPEPKEEIFVGKKAKKAKGKRKTRFEKFNATLWGYVENFYDDPSSLSGDFEIDDMVVDGFWELALHALPMLLSIIPIVFSGYEFYGKFTAILFAGAIIPLTLYLTDDWAMIVFNCSVCLCALGFDDRSEEMGRIVSAYIGTVVVLCASIFPQMWHKLGFVFLFIIMYVALLYDLFSRRRPGSQASLLIVTLLLIILHEQIMFARSIMARRNFYFDVVQMMLFTFLPFGDDWFGIVNMGFLAKEAATNSAQYYGVAMLWFLAFMIVQISMFLITRVWMGSMYVFNLRYRLSPDNIFDAFMTYCTGITNPFGNLLGQIFSKDEIDKRVLFYSLVGGVMVVCEARCSVEFFVMRVFMTAIDQLYYRGHYGAQHRYLTNGWEFPGRKFEQEGSLPRILTDKIQEISKHVVTILVAKPGAKGDYHRGAGLLLRGDGEMSKLFTIEHVVPNNKGFRIAQSKRGNMLEFSGRKVVNYRNSQDPVVYADVKVKSAANIPILTADDALSVEQLIAVIPDYELGGTVLRNIPEFKFDSKNKRFIVRSTFLEGDSGSPVFGCFDNGHIAYCGAISAGDGDAKAGNLVTALVRDSIEHCELSSDSEDAFRVDFNIDNREGVIRRATNELCEAMRSLNIYVDERGEKGFYDEDDPEYKRILEQERAGRGHQEDEEILTEGEEEQAQNRNQRKRQKRKKKMRLMKQMSDFKAEYLEDHMEIGKHLSVIESTSHALFGPDRTNVFLKEIRKAKGRMCPNEFEGVYVDEHGMPVFCKSSEEVYRRLRDVQASKARAGSTRS